MWLSWIKKPKEQECDRQESKLLPSIKERVTPDSIVYTDSFKAYNALSITEFNMHINHSKLLVDGGNLIKGIENFWGTKPNIICEDSMALNRTIFIGFSKECEYHFNGGNYKNLHNRLKYLHSKPKH